MNYVLGFTFDPTKQLVALIEKRAPAWQAGHLNGIGGKIEPGERASLAMAREYREETGVVTTEFDWRKFAVFRGAKFQVYCFTRTAADELSSPTPERVAWYRVDDLGRLPTLSGLLWLVPLARERDVRMATVEALE